MNKMLPTLLVAAAAAIVSTLAPDASAADAKDDALNLDQHVNPDVTPRDRYQAAMDKAADALKKNMAHCEKLASSERAECVRQARELNDADQARAADVLNRPQ